jgi:hypothetical protein
MEGREIPTTFITPRHTKKPKNPAEGSETSGEFYPGITPEGEEIVREKTRNEVMEVIEDSAPGSVIIFGGASDYIRTKSSTRVSGSELKKVLADRPDEFLILDEHDINSLVKEEDRGTQSTLNAVREIVASNPDKKTILIYPLYIEELSMDEKSAGRNAGKARWKTGGNSAEKFGPYVTEILRRNNNDEYAAVADWVESGSVIKGENGSEIVGPKAEETAEAYLTALRRLERSAKKIFPNRPLVIEATGHSWDLDVFITYLAKGKLDKAGLEEVTKGTGESNSIISEFEFPVIKVEKDKAEVAYRGKTYPIKEQF